MRIYKYTTEEEAQQIISENKAQGLVLVEISNITEGNFLGFAENSIPTPTTSETRLSNIENILDLILLKQEGIL